MTPASLRIAADFAALPSFALALAALLAKTTLTSALQVVCRLRAKTFLLPEDAALMRTRTVAAEAPFVQRCANVWRNDLENLPLFLFVALSYTLLGGEAGRAMWLFGAYALLRYVHTVVYLLGLQPWRAVLYLMSLSITWTLAVNSLWLALQMFNFPAWGA